MGHQQYQQPQVHDAVVAMINAPASQQRSHRNGIALTLLEQIPRWSNTWCRAGGDNEYQTRADLESEAMLAVLEILDGVIQSPRGDVQSWDAYLCRAVGFRVMRYQKSGAATGFAGALPHALQRETKAGHHIGSLMQELGRQPSAVELAESFNKEMSLARKNARRQSMFLSIAEAKLILAYASAA